MSVDFKPHPYQEKAIQHIVDNPFSGLFLEMGLGKTVCSLTAIVDILHDRFEAKNVLVIAPKRVAENVWPEEVNKWEHTDYLTISKVIGNESKRIRALLQKADIYVIGRDNIEWLVNHYKKNWPFEFVVIDELSSFKNSNSKRFRALKKVRPYFTRVIGLTGTPAPNGLLDLWPQLYLIDMGERLGVRAGEFKEKYFEPDKKGWQHGRSMVYSYRPKSGATDDIYRKISDICISMSAKDWLDLTEPVKHFVSVQLPPAAWKSYEQLERDLLLPLSDGDVIATTAAVLSGKLLQVANGAVYDEDGAVQEVHDAKLDALEDIIEGANGEPVLVCYAYDHDVDRIKKRFPQAVKGKTKEQLEAWNRKEIPVMLIHPQSAGHGLNLQQGGNVLVWYSSPWSLESYLQANARLQRQGQEKQVIIYHLIGRGTLDEDVIQVLDDKTEGQNALLTAVKARIAKVKVKMS